MCVGCVVFMLLEVFKVVRCLTKCNPKLENCSCSHSAIIGVLWVAGFVLINCLCGINLRLARDHRTRLLVFQSYARVPNPQEDMEIEAPV